MCATARTRQERIVSANSDCGPVNEQMKPPSSGPGVQRRAWTAPLAFSASS